ARASRALPRSLSLLRRPPRPTLFPYTPLFRSEAQLRGFLARMGFSQSPTVTEPGDYAIRGGIIDIYPPGPGGPVRLDLFGDVLEDRKSTRLNSSHVKTSYAVFCLKKKKDEEDG